MDRTRTIAHRVVAELGVAEALDALGQRASPSDLTPVLMDILRSSAARVRPNDVLDRHRSDRFATPSPIGLKEMRQAEDVLLSSVPAGFDLVVLSPLVPLGTHHVLGDTPQNNVVSTARRTEVAADPTAGLALEAAARRQEFHSTGDRSDSVVRLATIQRVTRAQTFEGPRSFAHFSLLGMVTAGRDSGSLEFEKVAVTEHVSIAAQGCLAAGASRVSIALTDFSDRMGDVIDHVVDALSNRSSLSVSLDEDRTRARGYYPSICFKVLAEIGDHLYEYGDGGLVDWSARLLGNAKERMMISALSVDRVALDVVAE